MKNGLSVSENSLASPEIPFTCRARQELENNLSLSVRLGAAAPLERKAIGFTSRLALRVLAPIDPSGDSKRTLEHAIHVARAMGAELSLLIVADPHSRTPRIIPRGFDTTLPASIDRFVVTGSVPEAITTVAEFIDASFVLMTSDDYRGRVSFWKRSATADLMKSTDRPILVTGLGDAEAGFNCRRILCALALDGTDDATVLQAEALARRSGGELILLSVVPEIDEGMLHEVFLGANRPLSTYRATDRIQGIGRRLSVPYRTSVMIGSPYRCIGLAARQYSVDLVVASRSELDMGAVFRRLTCPLLSVATPVPDLRGEDGAVQDLH